MSVRTFYNIDLLVVLLFMLSGVATQTVHLIPSHIICPNVASDRDILIPDPKDCTIFYRCENGSAVPQSCPPGLAWCQILSECTLPAIANCTIGHEVETYPPEYLSTTTSSPGPGPDENSCPEDGLQLPNPLDCSTYYECTDHIPNLEYCSNGTYYSCWIGECVDSTIADCIEVGSQENKTCPKNGIRLVYPGDCSKYYECDNYEVVIKSCPNDLQFNEWFQDCYSADLAYCDNSTTIVYPTTISYTTETVTILPGPEICPFPGSLLPNPLNCSTYYTCEDNLPVLKSCPEGFEYSCWDEECLPPSLAQCSATDTDIGNNCTTEGQTLPDSQDCQSYYICKNGVIQKQKCEEKKEYNRWFEECVDPSLSHCSIVQSTTTTESTVTTPPPSPVENICPIENATLPDPLNCHSFYICINKIPVPQTCPDNKEYSCWDQECLPPQSANCISLNQTGSACKEERQTMPDINNCDQYYMCVNGSAVLQLCESGKLFNEWFGICLEASLAHCIPITTKPEQTTSISEITPSGPEQSSTTPGVTETTRPGQTSTPEVTTSESGQPSPTSSVTETGSEQTSTPEVTTSESGQPSPTSRVTGTGSEQTSTPEVTTSESGQPSPTSSVTGTGSEQTSTPEVTTSESGQPSPTSSVTGTGSEQTSTPEVTTSESGQPSPTSSVTETGSEQTSTPEVTTSESGQPSPTSTVTETGSEQTSTPEETTSESGQPSPTPGITTNAEPGQTSTPEVTTSQSGQPSPTSGVTETGSGHTSTPEVTTSESGQPSPSSGLTETGSGQTSTPKVTTSESGQPSPTSSVTGTGSEQTSTPEVTTSESGQPSPTSSVTGTGSEQTSTPEVTTSESGQPSATSGVTETGSGQTSTPEETTSESGQPSPTPELTTNADPGQTSTPEVTTSQSEQPSPTSGVTETESGQTSTPEVTTSESGKPSPSSGLTETGSGQTSTPEVTTSEIGQPSPTSSVTGTGSEQTSTPEVTTSESGQPSPTSGVTETGSGQTSTPEVTTSESGQPSSSPGVTKPGQTSTPEVTISESGQPSSSPGVTATEPGQTTTISNEANACPVEGALLPDPLDCTKYYICKNNKSVTQKCPDGTLYSCWDQKCEKADQATCINDGSQQGKNCSIENEQLPNLNDCGSYCRCVNGQVQLEFCAQGTFYNAWLNLCVEFSLSFCKIYTTSSESTPSTTLPPGITTPPPSENVTICPFENATLPNPLDCTTYYRCVDETPILETCPLGYEYSCWDQQCLSGPQAICVSEGAQIGQNCSVENLNITNVQDCTNYYQCKDGKVQLVQCPNGLEFNSWYQKCVNSNLSHCQTYSTTEPTSSTQSSSSPTPSPGTDACPMEGALLPNPLNCSSYFKCINGTPTEEYCADGLEYSCWDQKCLPPDEAQCINEKPAKNYTCSINGLKSQNPEDCHSYYECVNHTVVLQKCILNWYYNKWFGICVPVEILAHCKTGPTAPPPTKPPPTKPPQTGNDICPFEGATLPNPMNCTTYYECQNNQAVLQRCPAGQKYSCWDQMCKVDSEAQCISDEPQLGLACSKEGVRLQNPNSCDKYYECINGKVELKYCFIGFQYNKWYQKCVLFPFAHCTKYNVTTTSPPVSTISTPPPSNSTNNCPVEGALLPDPLDCTKYYVCRNNLPVSQKCPDGLLYSCWDQKCESSDQAICIDGSQQGKKCLIEDEQLPNLNDCGSYYRCVNGKVQIEFCAFGTFYNSWFKLCVDFSLSFCKIYTTSTVSTPSSTLPPGITTPPPSENVNICPIENATLPNALDCTTYYRCKNETPILESCPLGYEYSCWDQQCLSGPQAICVSQTPQVGQNCSVENLNITNVQDCTDYYQCKDGKVQLVQCPNGLEFNSWYQKCVNSNLSYCQTFSTIQPSSSSPSPPSQTPSAGPETCPLEGALLPNPLNCSSYFKCINGTPTEEYCGDGLEYSCWDQKCLPPDEAQCINEKPSENYTCSINGLKSQNPENCHSYYECVNHTVVLQKCILNWYYNKWFGICVPQILAHCKTGPTAPPPTKPPPTKPPQTGNDSCPFEDATLPNPMNCTTYYECQNNQAVLQHCPAGQEYSCWDQMCKVDSEAQCISDEPQLGLACSKEGVRLQNPDSCDTYYECINGKVELKYCFIGFQYNKWYQKCVLFPFAHCTKYNLTTTSPSVTTISTPPPSNSTNNCPVEGALLPDPLDCTKYYVCRNNLPVSQKCPDGLLYSCWDQKCESSDEAICIDDGSQQDKKCLIEDEQLPNLNDCGSYYRCVNGKVQIEFCAFGTFYNSWFKLCVDFSLSFCKIYTTSTVSTPSSTLPPGITTPPPSEIVNICPIENATLPNPLDCTTYYRCKNETPILESCPLGYEYSCWDQQCLSGPQAICVSQTPQVGQNCSVENLNITNVQDCTDYYQCKDGKVQLVQCPNGLEFNSWYQKCVNSNLSYCQTFSTIQPSSSSPNPPSQTPSPTTDACPLEGALLPNPLNCSSYFKCINGTPTEEYCGDGLEYSCWDQECLPPDEAQCINEKPSENYTCSINGLKSQNPENCHSYYECVNHTVVLQKCILNWYYNKWFGICVPQILAHCKTGPTAPPPTKPPPTKPPQTGNDSCPFEDATLPNPMNCTTYYECQNNQAVLQHCPAGQEYSCWDQMCKVDSEAQCISDEPQLGLACSKEGVRLQNPDSCDTYYECINGKVELKYCFIGFQYNKWYQKCVLFPFSHCTKYNLTTTSPSVTTISTPPPSNSTNNCPVEGALLPDPLDCTKYYVCRNNLPVSQKCPDGLLYSCWDQKCESSDEAICIDDGSQQDKKCLIEDEQLPNLNDCGSYYRCVNGKVQIEFCAFGTFYNSWFKLCVDFSLSFCKIYTTSTVSTPSSTLPPGITTPPPSEIVNICPIENATLPNPLDCTTYYRCKNETPILESCPLGYEYSCWDQQCLSGPQAICVSQTPQVGQNCSVENLNITNVQDCTDYYQCKDGKVQLVQCPNGLEFNSWYQKCVNSNLSYCQTFSTIQPSSSSPNPPSQTPSPTTDACPLEGALLPNPLNCSSYFKCINGTPTEEYCGDGLEYSCWDQECLPPDEAQCINEKPAENYTCSINGVKSQNPEDCHSYYECVNHTVVLQKCILNWYYNKWFGFCVPLEILAHCKTGPTAPPPTKPPPTKPPQIGNDSCPFEGATLPNPMNCTTYFECQNNQAVLQHCPAGQEYSCWDQMCEIDSEAHCISDGPQPGLACAKEGVRIQNPDSCDTYYECINGKVELKYCFIGFQYNKWYQKCVLFPFAHCTKYNLTTTSPSVTTISTPPPSNSTNNCPVEGALLPDPLDCTKYYACKNNLPVSQKCPDGLLYSCWDQKCESSDQAICIDDGSQQDKKCLIEDEQLPNLNDCGSYYRCVNGKVQIEFCAFGTFYNSWFKLCVDFSLSFCKIYTTSTVSTPSSTLPPGITTPPPSENVTICPIENATLPNPLDCTTYYRCVNETPILESCPQGYGYSCWDQICAPAPEAFCVSSGGQDGQNCSVNNLNNTNVQDCTSYYQCKNGKVQLVNCPNGLEYNSWYQKCVVNKLSHCQTYTTISTVSVTPPASTSEPPTTNDACPIEGALLPDPMNCSTYYRCVNGTPILHLCADGLEYSCWDEKCEPPAQAQCIAVGQQTGKNCTKNGQKIANPGNCNSYYECVNHQVILQYCPTGFYYNKWFKKCVNQLVRAHCKPFTTISPTTSKPTPPPEQGKDICPIEGALLPDPTDCAYYYRCEHNTAIRKRCPNNDEYSCWDQTCKAESEGNCISVGSQLGKNCSREGERLQNIGNCNSFYECVNGKVEEKYCFLGFRYNKWYQSCTFFLFAHCNEYTTIAPPTTTTTSTTALTPTTVTYNTSVVCSKDDARVPNPNNCSTYFQCENHKPVLHECPNGYSYDCWNQNCLLTRLARCVSVPQAYVGDKCDTEGQTVPDVNNCKKYYVCEKGRIKSRNCPALEQYSVWGNKCMLAGLAKCANNKFLGII